jgi:hypothetical protein
MNHEGNVASNVTTKFFDPHSYAIDYSLIELKVNDGFIAAHTNQPTSYTLGGYTELNEAMKEVVNGYTDLGGLKNIVP